MNVSPKKHPNSYVGLSSAAISTFLVAECKRRLNVDITSEEAGMIVSAVVAAALFFGKKRAR